MSTQTPTTSSDDAIASSIDCRIINQRPYAIAVLLPRRYPYGKSRYIECSGNDPAQVVNNLVAGILAPLN